MQLSRFSVVDEDWWTAFTCPCLPLPCPHDARQTRFLAAAEKHVPAISRVFKESLAEALDDLPEHCLRCGQCGGVPGDFSDLLE